MPRHAVWVLCSLVGVAVAGEAPPRQLWGFKSPIDLEEFQAKAKEFGEIGSATNSQVASILTSAQGIAEDGASIADAFWEAILGGFIPLKPFYDKVEAVFEAAHAAPAMLSFLLGANVHRLYAFILNLERNVRHIGRVAEVCLAVAEVMVQMTKVVSDAEEHLQSGRRLSGTQAVSKSLLADPFQNDFEMYRQHFMESKEKADKAYEALSHVIKGSLAPVLELHFKLPEKESQEVDEAEADQRRRLEEDEDDSSILKDQKRYQRGLSKILPLWKKAEDLRLEMCPEVYRLHSLCGTFARRLQLFVQGGGTTTMGILDGVIVQTRPESIQDSFESSKARCPSEEFDDLYKPPTPRFELSTRQRVEGIVQFFVTIFVAGGIMIACRAICRPRERKGEGYRPPPDPFQIK